MVLVSMARQLWRWIMKRNVRAAGCCGQESLKHGEIGKLELAQDDIRAVDAGGCQGSAHGDTRKNLVHGVCWYCRFDVGR
jgi:hypothetical protein